MGRNRCTPERIIRELMDELLDREVFNTLLEAKVHTFVCTLNGPATMRITNPSLLSLGPMESGWIRILELPR